MRNLKKSFGKPLLLYLSLVLIFVFSAPRGFAADNQSHFSSWGKNISALFHNKKSGADDNKKNNDNKTSSDPVPVINNTIDTNKPDNNAAVTAAPVAPAEITTDTPPSITTAVVTTPKTAAATGPDAPNFIPTAYAAPAGDTLYSNQNFSKTTTRLLNEIAIALGVIGLLLAAGTDRWLRNKLGATDFNSTEQLTSS